MKNQTNCILHKPEMENILSYARTNHIPVLLTETAEVLIQQLQVHKPKNILEIGTAIGYSGTLMLLASNAQLTTIEKDEQSFKSASEHFKQFNLTHRVQQKLGDAYEILQQLVNENKQFDFIFLDGPKGQYFKYLQLINKLLIKGGVLFADNVYFKGMVFLAGTIPHRKRTIVVNLRKFLKELENTEQYNNLQVLNVGDGIAIAKKV